MKHHASVESFGRSVAEGCQLCLMIAEKIDFHAQKSRLSKIHIPFDQVQRIFKRSTEQRIYFVDTKAMTPLQEMKSYEERPRTPIFTEFSGDWNDFFSCSFVRVMVRTENPRHAVFSQPSRGQEVFVLQSTSDIKDLLRNHERSSNTGSIESFKQIGHWYRDCLQHHTHCNDDSIPPEYCPTRLVDIGVSSEEDKIFLVESEKHGKALPYMTLSHCWGTVPLFRHTALTAPKLWSGMPLVDLPRTFQDAVKIAKYLDCRYLWIDSLCIIQDDPKDWEVEAALMDKVYSHSLCNIAATGASNSLEGLFFERNPTLASPCIFEFQSANSTSKHYSIVPVLAREHSLLDQPLQKRGWVLQERRLARRLIDFTSRELLWQCHELEASETFPLGFPVGVGVKLEGSIATVLKESSPTGTDEWINHASIFIAWANILQDYTRRSLTQPGDKLIAVSGIAKQIQDRIGVKYVAGLWREALPQQLLWYVPFQNPGTWPTKRAVDYRAPSWSWASIDGEIGWGGNYLENDEEIYLADVLEVNLTPQSENLPLGSLKAGYIKVKANLWPIKLALNSEKGLVLKASDTGLELSPEFRGNLDVFEVGLERRKIFCMPVRYVKLEENEALRLVGLLLEQIDENGERFSRIGYYQEGMKYARVYYSIKLGKEEEGKREIIII